MSRTRNGCVEYAHTAAQTPVGDGRNNAETNGESTGSVERRDSIDEISEENGIEGAKAATTTRSEENIAASQQGEVQN
ncbi:hypothetical protein HN51_039545 [Arachis hypogaea]